MRAPLWLEVTITDRATISVRLRSCAACGKVGVTTDPCGLGHLAIIMSAPREVLDAIAATQGETS